ncbi:hypothetical protein HUJ04_000151 [Dendroctonus ponderosae]|nr:hypothetical protein HUJ04_000151 [Dendroctonus ponderosae]KAH1000233.1 hypothetical protein HUJ04_000151 [Dendroctonus ponderosae]
MLYLPLILGASLVAFGYSQDLELQTSVAAEYRHGVLRHTTEPPLAAAPSAEPPPERSTVNIIAHALAFLITQRESDWGWRNDTPKVLTALRMLQGRPTTNLELELSSKQMEIELVILLWRHHELPIAAAQLAEYCLALSALCYDPRQFHGHDLIGTLQHHEAPHDLDFAYATLAACTARAHVRKKQIRRLLDIANTAKDHNIGKQATPPSSGTPIRPHRSPLCRPALPPVLLFTAFRYSRDDYFGLKVHCDGPSAPEPAALAAPAQYQSGAATAAGRRLRQPLQHRAGDAGGWSRAGPRPPRLTRALLQALDDLTELKAYWNPTAARAYLETRQDPDGAFTDAGLTSDVLLALGKRGLGMVRLMECGRHDSDDESNVEIEGLTKSLSAHGNDSEIRNVSITYTLWVGSNVTENCTVAITAPRNTSFYAVMQTAMEQDARFAFEASEWPNGHYVHTLAGYKEEPMGYNYWLLYRLPELPDPSAPPANQLVAPVGVDDLLIEEGDHYLFWYKKL